MYVCVCTHTSLSPPALSHPLPVPVTGQTQLKASRGTEQGVGRCRVGPQMEKTPIVSFKFNDPRKMALTVNSWELELRKLKPEKLTSPGSKVTPRKNWVFTVYRSCCCCCRVYVCVRAGVRGKEEGHISGWSLHRPPWNGIPAEARENIIDLGLILCVRTRTLGLESMKNTRGPGPRRGDNGDWKL